LDFGVDLFPQAKQAARVRYHVIAAYKHGTASATGITIRPNTVTIVY
jgi:hypothetical protein